MTSSINIRSVVKDDDHLREREVDVPASRMSLYFRFGDIPVPGTASDPGERGMVTFNEAFIYVCIAENTWVRGALATWEGDPL